MRKLGPLTQSSYEVIPNPFGGTFYTYTFTVAGGGVSNVYYTFDSRPYRPPIDHRDASLWGSPDAGTGTSLTSNVSLPLTFDVSNTRTLTPASYSAGGVLSGSIYEEVRIRIPRPQAVQMGDDFRLPFALPISFSPALPTWFMDPAPTHAVYGPDGMVGLYALGAIGDRSESIDWPWFFPYLGGAMLNGHSGGAGALPVSGPLDDRIVRCIDGLSLYRNSDDGIYLGRVTQANGFTPKNFGDRHYAFPTVSAAGAVKVEPAHSHDIFMRCRYYSVGTAPVFVDFYAGALIVAGTGGVPPFDFCNFSISFDLEAHAPAGAYAVDFALVFIAPSAIPVPFSLDCALRPFVPVGACRDAVGEEWLPGRILKVG